MSDIINKLIKFIVTLVVFMLMVAVAFWFGHLTDQSSLISELIRQYGWLGVLLISFLSGFSLILPAPTVSFLPVFLVVNQSIWLVILVITIGMTLGDFLGFLLGRYGREIGLQLPQSARDKLKKLRDKYYYLPLVFLFFYTAFVPAPNELLVIPMAVLGYKARYLMPIIFIGNTIFNIAVAFGFMHFINLLS